jgi:L-alanine-DL-glutamate epimerase-like enolase superfamily enzyme
MRTCRVVDSSVDFEDIRFRVPLRFGTGVVEMTRLATARVTIEDPSSGRRAEGLGQILLSELWAFPSAKVERADRQKAMQQVAEGAALWLRRERPEGHPLEIGQMIKSEAVAWSQGTREEFGLAERMPLLAGLNSVSLFDAALHDAFGKLLGRSAYDCCGPDVAPDLSAFLGPAFRGKFASQYLRERPRPRVPIWHLVGGLDKLRESEATADDPRDGLPVSLEKWIERDGVYCLKVKITGHDIDADVRRTAAVYEVAGEAIAARGGDPQRIALSADSNEQTEGVEACVAFLEKLHSDSPAAFDALLYLEQPTGRDLKRLREDMRPAARIKPVLVDEAVSSLEDLDLAYELGWSGVALKTCKGHTATLLSIAKTMEAGKVYSIQDLTNPACAYIHSVGLAARTNPLLGVEANARQFIPAANAAAAREFPGLFTLRDGEVETSALRPTGLGF